MQWIKKPDGMWELRSNDAYLERIVLACVKTEIGTGVVVAMVMGQQLHGQWNTESIAKERCVSVLTDWIGLVSLELKHLQKRANGMRT